MALNTVFEKEVCGRCGGSGSYSYNQRDGSRCYGCGGRGERLTKRGAAASKYFHDLCAVRADEVKAGDLAEMTAVAPSGAMARYFATVVEVGPRDCKMFSVVDGKRVEVPLIAIKTESAKFGPMSYNCGPDALIRKGQTADEKRAKLDQALAYQATLTKTGKPRAR